MKIGNIGLLDIRNITDETIAEIEAIGNVGLMLFSPETAHFVARLDTGNVGAVVQASRSATVVNSRYVIASGQLRDSSPLELFVNGTLIVEPEVTAEEIEAGLRSVGVNGQVLVPRHLAGVFQSRVTYQNGKLTSYDPKDVLVTSSATFDAERLSALPDDTSFHVAVRLALSGVIDDGLLRGKIARISGSGRLRLHEENAACVSSLIASSQGDLKLDVIPAGFTLVEEPVTIDEYTLGATVPARIYATDIVKIDASTPPDAIGAKLEGIAGTGVVICPASLRAIVQPKIADRRTQTVFYHGKLWLVDEEAELTASRFEYETQKATLAVTGELRIDPEVEPKQLAEHFDAIHNFGEIRCTKAQHGALQARLVTSKGELHIEDDNNGDAPANFGILTL